VARDLDHGLEEAFIQQYDRLQDTVDRVQIHHRCCGVKDFSDWSVSAWALANPGLRVPDSCCKTPSPGCGVRDHPSNIAYTGCRHKVQVELVQHLWLVSVTSLGVGLAQVVGMMISTCLLTRMRTRRLWNDSQGKGTTKAFKDGYWRSVPK